MLVSSLLLALSACKGFAAPARVATSWYAGWHADAGFPLSKVSWGKYTHLTYAFAETTSDVHTLSLLGSDPELLPQFVSTAHENKVTVSVSIGGWTGSLFWSSNVGSAKNRTAFVKTVTEFATKYNLDGLDFDWEYPASQGIGCNVVKTQDTTNFLSFIQELRQDPVGAKLILSAATATVPFTDANGNQLTNVKPFAKVLDYIAVMNYDIWGPWSPTVGPNSPLNDTCAAADNQVASAVSAVKAWNQAGMPLDQIVLGVASYGHSFRVLPENAFVPETKQLALFAPFDASNPPAGDAWDDAAGIDECGNEQSQGGVIDFWGLIQQGYLSQTGTPVPSVPFVFDECSQTPFVYNTTTNVMISFDNAQSFAAKGKFIKETGIRGFAMWEAGGDFNDILLDSIIETSGIKKCA